MPSLTATTARRNYQQSTYTYYLNLTNILMKPKKRRSKILPELLAARKANREVDRLLLGDGFHARTRIKKSKKLYCRKKKHPEPPAF